LAAFAAGAWLSGCSSEVTVGDRDGGEADTGGPSELDSGRGVDSGPAPEIDSGPALDAGGGDVDAGGSCGGTACTPGQVCCEATGRCYDPACLSCCMPGPIDGGPGPTCHPAGESCIDAVPCCEGTACVGGVCEAPTTLDAGSPVTCGGSVCAPGQLCCECRGTCYDPACLSCCMFCPPDAGPGGMCSMTGESCVSQPCCGGLDCCSGVPVPPGADYCAAPGSCPISDRNRKTAFESVDPESVLARVSELEISEWSYRDEPGVRHMGPMAQDFHASFGLGADDRHIFVLDGPGVSLAAIQALARRTESLAAENTELRAELDSIRTELQALRERR
jgi:hypothetical protein